MPEIPLNIKGGHNNIAPDNELHYACKWRLNSNQIRRIAKPNFCFNLYLNPNELNNSHIIYLNLLKKMNECTPTPLPRVDMFTARSLALFTPFVENFSVYLKSLLHFSPFLRLSNSAQSLQTLCYFNVHLYSWKMCLRLWDIHLDLSHNMVNSFRWE